MLSEPRPEYHGIKIQETFGNFAFAIACRVLGLRDLGLRPPAPLSPFQRRFFILNRYRNAAAADAKALRERQGDRGMAVDASGRGLGQHAGFQGDKYNNLARKYAPRGAGAVFTFSLKGGYDAGVQSGVEPETVLASCQCRRHPRSLVIHPASTTHQPARRCAKIKSGAATRRGAAVDRHRDKEDLIADLDQALNA